MNMKAFAKKGTKVKCVDAGSNYLTTGKIYELSCDFDPLHDQHVVVKENDKGYASATYQCSRFEAVQAAVEKAYYKVERDTTTTYIIIRGDLSNEQVSKILAVVQ
jgi:hypothetical protein